MIITDFKSKVNVIVKINLNRSGGKKDNLFCFAFLAEASCWESLKYFINIWQCFAFIVGVYSKVLDIFLSCEGDGVVWL